MATIDPTVRPTFRKRGCRAWRINDGAVLMIAAHKLVATQVPIVRRSLTVYAVHGDRATDGCVVLNRGAARALLAELRERFK